MSLTWSVSPLLFGGGWLTLRWFTVFWLFELVFGFWLLSRQVRRGGGEESDAADLAVHLYLGLLLGARLGEALFYNLDLTMTDPAWVLRLSTGGISSHGAVVGAATAAWLYARRRSLSSLDVTDRSTLSFAAAAITHRIANLFNSEIVGKPTHAAWGMRFPSYDALGDAPLRHPSQLYEAAMGVALVALIFAADRHWQRERRPRGALTGLALCSYFLGRFAVEFWKAPQPGEAVGALLNVGQWLSIPFVATGAVVLWVSLSRKQAAGFRLHERTERGAPSVDDAPASA